MCLGGGEGLTWVVADKHGIRLFLTTYLPPPPTYPLAQMIWPPDEDVNKIPIIEWWKTRDWLVGQVVARVQANLSKGSGLVPYTEPRPVF